MPGDVLRTLPGNFLLNRLYARLAEHVQAVYLDLCTACIHLKFAAGLTSNPIALTWTQSMELVERHPS